MAIHLVGGLAGTLLVGVFATSRVNPAVLTEGLVYGGGWTQLGRQAIAAGVVAGYSFLATLVLGFLIRFTIGFRASADAEHGGLDLHQHAETGYDITAGRGGLAADATPPTGVPLQRTASDQRLTAPVRVEHPKRYP